MSIISKIRVASLDARKNRDSIASLLTTLLSEVSIVGKNANRETTDDEAIAVIKKFIKNNADTLSLVTDESIHVGLTREIEVLEAFLPKQLNEDELRFIILDILDHFEKTSQKKDMGSVMKTLKNNFGGRYDGALASKIIKELL